MSRDILIVDDESDIRSLTAAILVDEGYEPREAADSDAALQSVAVRRPNLVILDIWLQGSRLDGLEVLDRIKADHPDLPVVMISGHGNIETAVSAIKRGAYDFIEKPFKTDRLLLLIERAMEAADLRRENAELRLRAGSSTELIGQSNAVQQIRQAIDRVAPTSSRVLITGQAGVGKEVVARLIHDQSRRADGAFVVLNCANMEPDRMGSELFGVQAAANGTSGQGKVGAFERAHNGTMLLDEVADMPLETQGKILRVLQEQTFERMGGGGPRVEVNVRVVATTSRSLTAEIEAGRFREDLYYRLNVVPIQVPSLRERRDDIPALAQHFIKRSSEVSGIQPRAVGEDALAALQAYDWPGNVRQLRNVADWLLIMSPGAAGAPIRADMLPPEIGSTAPPALNGDRSGEIMGLPLREAREIFEREYLLAQITRFGGNVSRTASFVGMERSALHRKLKNLGVAGSTRGPDGEE